MTAEDMGREYPQRRDADQDEDLIDIRALINVLRRRMGVIAGSVLLITGITLLVVFQLTPLYTASAQILIDPREQQVVDIEAVMSGLPPDSAAIDSEVEVLRSRTLAARAVEQLELVNDPEFNSVLREPGMMASLDPRSWFASENNVPAEDQARIELNRVIDALQSRLSVSRRGLTYVISISFTSEDAVKATKVVNTIADLYVLEQLEAKYEATKRANDWLNGRLTELRGEVRAAQEAVEIYRRDNDLVASSGVTVNEQQLAELNGQLILARADLAEREAKFRRYRELLRSGSGADTLADVLQSPVIAQLRQQEAEVTRRLAELSSRYGDRHPEMIKVRAERRDLAVAIDREVGRTVANVENEVEVTRTRVASLQNSLNELQGRSGEGGLKEVRLRELESDAEAVRTLYESFLERFKQTTEQTSLQEADSRILSEATVPNAPSYPNKTLFLALALVGSGMVGVGLAFALEQLDDAFSNVAQLEKALGLPHLASVPEVSGDLTSRGPIKAPFDVILKKPLSAYSEAFRALRSGIALSDVDNPPQVVLVTSALPGDGKTTTAISLARAADAAGIRTVLVDCDLRRPTVHKSFGVTPEAGIVEVLAGQADLESVLLQDPQSSLQILPVRSGAANPPDLLGSNHMANLLKRLRGDFDLVILDSAPVLPVVDSRVLSRLSDKVVFVVAWRNTPRDAAGNAVRDLRDYGADIAGVLFERLDLKKQQRYSYGDSGYYYGRYSKYYIN
ncbi:polysaccharide biosynthesis tyrosine autokinase [Pyruvatibacter sp.]|uniref:GumC family protein n=1 Tax=Pyruvatibacter sp. TaxID=1981328 RepID=UPI0032EE3FCA